MPAAGAILPAAALAAGMLGAQGVGVAPGRMPGQIPGRMTANLPDRGIASSAIVSVAGESSVEVLKVIADPHTGTRWLLLRDLSHPGGPGRLVPASELTSGDRPSRELPILHTEAARTVAQPEVSRLRPVIRTGDRLIVEEHTAVVDATLEAVALSSALPGAAFDVRLKWGGKVLRVWAAGPGRALLDPPSEVKP